MEFIIISGLSGAGKSKVASLLEDIGFYVVDNMPAPLMPKFAELCMAGPGRYDRVALVTDIRGGQTFDGLFDALHELHRMGCAYKILFVEASVETIIKRYKETRRMHPLSSTSRSLDEAVRQERTVLAPVRQRAEYIIDTSALSTAKLRGEVLRLFGDGGSTPAMSVSVISFGFKYGIPIEADLVFDVRFLPNPYYIAELRHQTGLDEGVYSFVFGYQQTKDFMAHLESLIGFLLPQYVEEGKAALVIGVGCTGGQHRFGAITKALANAEPMMQQLLTYRFPEGSGNLTGQSFGNLILAALNGISDSFDQAVARMSEVLAISGRVLPVTNENVALEATFENGTRVLGESKISAFKKEQDCRIESVRLLPEHPKALPEAVRAIGEAELILLGPGSLYTSVIPNLLVDGIADAVRASDALKIYICNIMTQDGETEGMTASDHVKALLDHSGPGLVDLCLCNSAPVRPGLVERYREEDAAPIVVDRAAIEALGVEAVTRPLASETLNYARHSFARLAEAVMELYNERADTKIF